MRKTIDKNLKSYIDTKRNYVVQGAVTTPHMAWYPDYYGTVILDKLAPGYGFDSVINLFINEGNHGKWIFSEEEFFKKGGLLIANPKLLKNLYKVWQKNERIFYKEVENLTRYGIRSPLTTAYERFSKLYGLEYAPAIITEYFTVWGNHYAKTVIDTYNDEAVAADVTILAAQTDLSFMQVEELELRRIAIVIAKKRSKNINVALKRHQQNFFWLHNNYKHTNPIDVGYFANQLDALCQTEDIGAIKKRIKELENYAKITKKQKQLTRECTKLGIEQVRCLELLGFISTWHDHRKRANLVANHWINKFIQAGAEKLGMTTLQAQFLLPGEFVANLKKEKFPHKLIDGRLKDFSYLILRTPRGFKDYDLKGADFEKLRDCFLRVDNQSAIIKGLGVSQQRPVRGVVYCVDDPRGEGKNFPAGAVLVTYMTRPDFLPFMKRASAIVTDEGGVTCHAAIVARELKIPCVVGTKIAMRTLKTGDRVEIDSQKGTVTKLV